MEITPELARIHAHLCGDGSVFIYPTKQKGRRFIAEIGYYNKNQKLLDSFRTDFSKLFGVKMKMRSVVSVTSSSITRYNQFTAMFGSFKSYKWRIPLSIKDAAIDIKIEWLKAFFHDEAYHEKKYNRLKTKSMNFEGLRDVQEILSLLEIPSRLTGPNCDNSYYLTISRFNTVDAFRDFVKEPARKKIAEAGFEPCDPRVMGPVRTPGSSTPL